jgi:hypothetical protein
MPRRRRDDDSDHRLHNEDAPPRPIDGAAAEDRAYREAYGRTLRSAYYPIIGDAPDCGPGERDKARAHWERIEKAIEIGGWSGPERTRLYRLRDKWKARAEGKDARFEVAGTRAGRLDSRTEDHVSGMQRHTRALEGAKAAIGKSDRRRKQHDWSAYEDLDAPFGKARGGVDLADLEGDLGDDETGEANTRGRSWTDREFLIPGQDSKGHSHRVFCRVMPAHFRALTIIKESRRFPFRTLGDIVRWSIDRGIRQLGEIAKNDAVSSTMLQVDAVMAFLADEQYQHDFGMMFESLRKTIEQHMASQAVGEARRCVAVVKHQIEKMPEGYWRDRYLGQLKQQFGHLLDASSGTDNVSLIG